MKKLAVIGGGTAGLLSVLHFLRWSDYEVDWYFEDNQKYSSAKSTNLIVPKMLWVNAGFGYNDLNNIGGTLKTGILKKNWGVRELEVADDFLPPLTAYHFDDIKLRNYLFPLVTKDKRLKIYNTHITHDQIDADHIMDCSGKPSDLSEFNISDYSPVNSIYNARYLWENPTFNNSLQIAGKYGWVFGHPLQDRCDFGYVFNDKLIGLDKVKEDLKSIVSEILTTTDIQNLETNNLINIDSYHRKTNFSDRVVYNGDASFFVEPMEATSIAFIGNINAYAFELWNNNKHTPDVIQAEYEKFLNKIENFIMLQYFAGSIYDTTFWKTAKQKADLCMDRAMNDPMFVQYIYESNQSVGKGIDVSMAKTSCTSEYGYFWYGAFHRMIRYHDIYPELISKLKQ